MALEGSIQDFGLTDIIQFLRQQTKTGVLSVQSNERWTKIYFKDGMIVSAATAETEGIDWLYQRLLKSGRIGESQLKPIMEHHRDPGSFATGLQEAGLITQQDLSLFFKIQTKETLFALFRLKEGEYRFDPTSLEYNQKYSTPIDSDFILLEGMRQLDEWPNIKKQINSKSIKFEKNSELIDKVSVFHEEISFDEEATQEQAENNNYLITDDEMAVYQFIDGQRNVQQLEDMALIGEFQTHKVLLNLVSKGLIYQKIKEVAKTPKSREKEVAREISPSEKPSYSVLSNTILLVILLTWVLLFAPRLKENFLSFQTAVQITDNEKSKRKNLELIEAINIFYYRNSMLPENLKELTTDIQESQSLVDHLSDRGLHYDIEDQGFRLLMDIKL
jgi:hypothetical protein